MSNISINNAIPENALERQLYFIEKCKEHSFMQTVSMSNLLRKRGFETKFLGWKK